MNKPTLYMKNLAEEQGFINQGWFSESEILAAGRHLVACVYGFYYGPKRPTKEDFPCDLEATLYIGQTAGKFRFDQKNSNGTGQIKSTFVTRWHDHQKNITKARAGTSTNPKYILLAQEATHPDWSLWINILSPDVNGIRETLKRLPSKCIAIEGVGILDYSTLWGDAPLMNRAQSERIIRRKSNSISTAYMKNVIPLHFEE